MTASALPVPVYVIGGWMRSGTSMMMRALRAGGMDVAYSPAREETRRRHADQWYDPNAGGLLELDQADYQAPGFPAGYEGRLIKCLRSGPSRMAHMPGGIRVVYMLRDHEEQRQSLLAFFGRVPPSVQQLEAETARNLAAIRARADIALMTLEYTTVLADPHAAMAGVARFFGVRLDVAAAAAVVDPALYRYRAPELVPGIV